MESQRKMTSLGYCSEIWTLQCHSNSNSKYIRHFYAIPISDFVASDAVDFSILILFYIACLGSIDHRHQWGWLTIICCYEPSRFI